MLSLYPEIEVASQKFISDLQTLPEESLLFLYQGLVEIEELLHANNSRFDPAA